MSLFNMNLSKVQIFLYLLAIMVINVYKHMGKVVIKILQGSAVTQTVLDGLTIYPPVANFHLAVDKVNAKISRLTFLAHPVVSPSGRSKTIEYHYSTENTPLGQV